MIITPEACEFAPRHLLTLVTTRRARDWFRRRYWLRCRTCPLVRGPFTTTDAVAQSLDIENSQLRSIDICRAAASAFNIADERLKLVYIRNHVKSALSIRDESPQPTEVLVDELIRRFYHAQRSNPAFIVSELDRLAKIRANAIRALQWEGLPVRPGPTDELVRILILRYEDVLSRGMAPREFFERPPTPPGAFDNQDKKFPYEPRRDA